MFKTRPLAGAAALFAAAMSSTIASAQGALEIPLQFDFVNPGAKSLALGGAFAGVADDATASFANPAGLTLLLTPEVSGEFRFSRVRTPFLQFGRLSGLITNVGNDDYQGPFFNESIGVRFGARYAAVVYPHPSHRWVIAGYRHELARVIQGTDQERIYINGVFQQDPTESISHRDSPQSAGRSVKITGYGVSGAYKPYPNVSLGVGLAAYTFSLDSTALSHETNGTYGDVIFEDDGRFNWLVQEGDAIGFAPTLGLTVDRGRARVGVVYRRGASFDLTTRSFVNTARFDESSPRSGTFRVPHTLALGVSMRATPRLLVSTEVTRIQYSRLVNDFVVEQARPSGQQASFRIDDGTELHVSAQYAWGRQRGAPVRLRAGAWYDPDHSVHFRAARTPTTVDERLFDERFAVALSRGTSQAHLTGGVGLNLGPRVEFNAGVDIARLSRQFSASVILHVGKGTLP